MRQQVEAAKSPRKLQQQVPKGSSHTQDTQTSTMQTRSRTRVAAATKTPIVTLLIAAILAFQAATQTTLAQQPELHEQASVAPNAQLVAESGGAGALVDSASALASPDDLIAAESSQSPDAEPHKAFTSAQVLRQQEQSAASIAPALYGPAQANLQAGGPQQPLFHQHPQQMQAARFQPQAAHPKAPHMNPFMAAALAGNYGPAQQQMAAAALHAQQQQHHHPQQMHHPHQHQQHAAQAPAQGGLLMGQQQQLHNQAPQQHQQAMVPQQQQQQQQQQAAPMQQQHHQMAVQESSIRHNIVPAPSVEANSIELGGEPAVAPAHQSQSQPQAPVQPPTQLAVASSVQHPVITSASTAIGSASGQPQEAWPLQSPDIPKIVNLEVKCEKNLMKVSVEFDKIFNGVIFSKGHFNQGQCVHVGPQSNKQQAYFDISINSCGTQGNTQNGLYGMGQNTGSGTFFENTIVIQYDPNVQEVYDHARKLRCTWHDQYEKAVTFRPFPVDMLDIVRADFAGDNVGCWMQIQVGKGPWASEVAGIVKIGQTMTMVLAIKDEENKFDMLVRNCFAHDGKRGPIELVDKSGCITRPKLMSRFTKIKNFGSSATVLSYAHFQAFKFPDSMEVHFQCTIQICRHQCPEQCSAGPGVLGAGSGSNSANGGETYSESTISGTFNIHSGSQAASGAGAGDQSVHVRKFGSPALSRERRSATQQHQRWLNGSHHNHNHLHGAKPLTQNVGVNRVIQVVSSGDLAFAVNNLNKEQRVIDGLAQELPSSSSLTNKLDLTGDQICMSSYNFVLALVMLVLILLCSGLLAISLYIRQRSFLASGQQKLKTTTTTSSKMNKNLLNHHIPSSQTTPPPTNNSHSTLHHHYNLHNNVPTQSSQYFTERH